MTRSRTAEMARGLTAALAIAALVVGPPILLSRFIGWPLPHNPNLDDITHSLRGTPISDQVLLKALAMAGWVAWANALACLVAEVLGWRRQRTAARVPLGGLFQPLISQLVLSAGLLLTTARTLTPAPTSGEIQPRPPVLAVSVQEIPAAAPTPAPSTELPTCVVQRRDSLWVLAERHLGDGLRWREIYDLNQGRPQPGGRTLRDPNLIRPGWTLRLPADAAGIDASAPPAVPAPPVASLPGNGAPSTVPPPSVPAPPESGAPETTTPSTTTATTPSVSAPSATGTPPPTIDVAADADDQADDRFPVPVALAGATLLAAALVLKIDALRRRQMRRRPPGQTIPAASAEAAGAERLLRAAAANKPASRLDLALRLLAHQLADGDANDCRVDTVRVADDAVEILLTCATDAPAGPFEVTGGRVWTLPADTVSPELEKRAARQTAPAPALVTVGRMGDADVLIDVETAPLIITGDRSTAQRVLWSITTELATSPWADDIQLLYVGEPPGGVAGLDRVEVFPTFAAAAEAAASRCAATQRELSNAGYGDAWSARLANHGDGWPPTVVVAAEHQSGDVPGASVVRIADHAEEGARNLVVNDQGCHFEPLGLALALPGLPVELIEPTEELLAAALSDEPGPEIDLRVPEPARYVAPPELQADDITPTTDGAIVVRILGPVVIDGAPSVNRRRVKELIVYIALHPEGVTTEQITAALWPADTPTRAAYNQTVTRARAALGDDPDGQPYIGYVHDGRYRPSRYLLCDAVLLEHAIARSTPIDHIAMTGEPFAGTPGFDWAYVEGHAYRAAALMERLRDTSSSSLVSSAATTSVSEPRPSPP